MDKALQYNNSIEFDHAERELLEKILDHYDLKYHHIERARSAYRIFTEDKDYCLKMLGRGYKRAHKSYFLSHALQDKGFDHVAPYYYTKDDEYLIKHKKSSFYITYWIDGREVSFKNTQDILDSAGFLASFHLAAKGLDIPKNIKIRNKHGKWLETFSEHIEQVKDFDAKLNKKTKFTGFDILFRNNLHMFMAEAEFAVKLMSSEEAKRALELAQKENYICHESFYYQNILRDKNGKLYLIDLESSQLDSPMSDLGKFIRRIICKTKYKWDFDLCRRIIDAYDQVRPISEDELYPLLAMIVFPHKFWKFAKKRYIKKKPWTEAEFQTKLKKVINMRNYKRDFVRNFIMFYGIKV